MAAMVPKHLMDDAAEKGEVMVTQKPTQISVDTIKISRGKMARGFTFLVLLFGITLGAIIWRGFVMLRE